MADLKIKFSHVYPKLHGQTKGYLIDVGLFNYTDLDKDFIAYDTHYQEQDAKEFIPALIDKYYPLSKGLLLVLTFIGNKKIPFTTLRRAAGNKMNYYRSCIGKEFDIVIVKEEPEAQAALPI